MPTSPDAAASFVTIEYKLRFTPSDIPDTEKERLKALMAIRHLRGLCSIVRALSAQHSIYSPATTSDDDEFERAAELDDGCVVLGDFMMAVADEAAYAVRQMAINYKFDILLAEGELAMERDKRQEVKTTVANRPNPKTGKTKRFAQVREAKSGRYVARTP